MPVYTVLFHNHIKSLQEMVLRQNSDDISATTKSATHKTRTV